MEKILVSLECPSISASYDVYIPGFLSVGMVASLIGKALEELSDYHYVSSGHEFLCLKEKRLQLQRNAALKDYRIDNGAHLVIMQYYGAADNSGRV